MEGLRWQPVDKGGCLGSDAEAGGIHEAHGEPGMLKGRLGVCFGGDIGGRRLHFRPSAKDGRNAWITFVGEIISTRAVVEVWPEAWPDVYARVTMSKG